MKLLITSKNVKFIQNYFGLRAYKYHILYSNQGINNTFLFTSSLKVVNTEECQDVKLFLQYLA